MFSGYFIWWFFDYIYISSVKVDDYINYFSFSIYYIIYIWSDYIMIWFELWCLVD